MNLQALWHRSLNRHMGSGSVLLRFWRWWSGEILYFVPPRLRAALDRQERLLRVSVRDSELHVSYRHGHERRDLGRIGLVGDSSDEGAAKFVAPEADRVIVELSPTQAARRQVNLPIGTEERLADVIGYEMDRLTPFAVSDVYFDYRVTGRDPTRGVVSVDLVVGLREIVDGILQRLEGLGIRATQLTVPGTPPSTNLLPKGQRASAASRFPVVPAVLTGLAVGLAVTAVAYPLVHQRLELARLATQLDELRPAALAADEVRNEIASATEQSNFFATRWKAAPTKIELLNELAAVIPDDTWLTRVQFSGETVRIQGESEGASSLIGLIEASPLLEDAGFSSPVTKNPRSSNDRFSIEARIVLEDGRQ